MKYAFCGGKLLDGTREMQPREGLVLCPMALLFVKQLHDSGWLRLWK